MKKIAFLFISLFFINAFSAVETYAECEDPVSVEVSKQGGELNGVWPFRWVGFDYVHQDADANTLTCTGKGVNECELQSNAVCGHDADVMVNNMIDHFVMEVADGVLDGTYSSSISIDGDDFLRTVDWTTDESTGTSDAVITIVKVN